MKRILTGILLIVVLSSHDMFLRLDSYFHDPNTDVVIKLFNGTFEKSENVITRDRMVDVSLVSNGQRMVIDTAQWYDKDSTTYLRLNTGEAGTKVVGVSTAARDIALAAEDFNDYLEHDGVLDMLESRKNNNTLDQDAVERYSKHVKTIFQVGEELTEDWNTVLGYPIEFVPQQNPYDIHPGHSLEVKLLFNGQPLRNQLVYVGNELSALNHSHDVSENEAHIHKDSLKHTHEGDQEQPHDEDGQHSHGHSDKHTHENSTSHSHENQKAHKNQDDAVHTHDDSTANSHKAENQEGHEHKEVQQLRTDENGLVSIDITTPGIWYLRTIHLVHSEEEELTHESNWATLTFAIGEGHSHEHAEEEHAHEDEGIPSFVYWIGSLLLVLILFFWFNRKR